MGGVSTGGGGASSSSAAQSGPAQGQSGSGSKVFNLGGNPNIGANTLGGALSNPFVLVGIGLVAWFVLRKK